MCRKIKAYNRDSLLIITAGEANGSEPVKNREKGGGHAL